MAKKKSEPLPFIGAPSKYREEYDKKIVLHMGKGFSFASFAAQAGVSIDTLYEWVKVHKSFSDAKRLGKAKCLEFWESKGIEGLVSTNSKKFNPSVWVFNMKNRFGWHDQVKEKAQAPIPITITYEPKKKSDE